LAGAVAIEGATGVGALFFRSHVTFRTRELAAAQDGCLGSGWSLGRNAGWRLRPGPRGRLRGRSRLRGSTRSRWVGCVGPSSSRRPRWS